MIVAPIPIIFLFVLVQFVVVTVRLVPLGPIAAVYDVLVVIPSMPVTVIIVVNSHAASTARVRKYNYKACRENC